MSATLHLEAEVSLPHYEDLHTLELELELEMRTGTRTDTVDVSVWVGKNSGTLTHILDILECSGKLWNCGKPWNNGPSQTCTKSFMDVVRSDDGLTRELRLLQH